MNILSCSKQHNSNTQYFSSIKEISKEVWEDLGCTDNLYFAPQYLVALEQNNPKIHFAYIVLFDDKNAAVALANVQIVDFYLDSVQNDMQSIVDWVKCMGRKLRIISPEKPFKVLTCGNTFVSGEHGVFIKNDQDKKEVLRQIAKAVVNYSNSNSKNSADAFMLKDFEKESLYITHELHEEGYNSFKVDPNMVLELDGNWNSLDDYLAALKTKFRVKARRALKLSCSLKVEDVTEDRLKDLQPEMTNLYKTVSAKSSFNLGDFNLETYRSLKENLGENYFLKAYWLEDKLVGFLSGIFNKKSLDAHFVGIDYEYNREYAVYQRMLYDYIQLGIDKKVDTINFGRTASEIKSSVGAKPQDLTIYLRHKNTIPNRILSLFLKRIQPSEFKQKQPFKKKELRAQVNL
ncbi:GNAT family N-acetyltransferase [uncultured Tenacibaculum sp.]|uniref:GNAT family N-acetyltransferase n=1 Tax=uncultured Tenacibaculum sp. TaxID=174713 RepID=UPI00260BC46C|nr:GNAT family N-acetyltransferase [uncultured Tenacibaculum sp.]